MELRRWRYFFLCLIVLVSTMQLRADVTGSILGYVRDKSGAVLPNATVTAARPPAMAQANTAFLLCPPATTA